MAITIDFGKCAQCSENNPKQLQSCRKCSAPLPWAKVPKPTVVNAPRSAHSQRSAISQSAGGFDWGVFGIGVISFMIPIIGYFMYRSYSDTDESKAGAALTGAILGIVIGVISQVVRVASR